jgi:hypothetical protein
MCSAFRSGKLSRICSWERRLPCDRLLPKPGAAGGGGRLGAAAAALAATGLTALAAGESGAVGLGAGEPLAGGGGLAAELMLACPLNRDNPNQPLQDQAPCRRIPSDL